MDSNAQEENLRNLLKTFAGEVFDFFSSNVTAWQESPESLPLYELFLEKKNVSFFKPQVKKAVVTLTYLFRNECRKKFQEISDDFKIVESYESYAMRCCVPKDEDYLLHFLAWTAFLLELTTYCYIKGYDYSEAGQRCLAKYPNILCFSRKGGWNKVFETSDVIAIFYDPLIASLYGKFPESDILVPFLRALNDIFRFDKYEQQHVQIKKSRDIDRNLFDKSPKLRAVLPYDPQKIRFGRFVTRNDCPDKSRGRKKVCSPKSQNVTIQIEKMKYSSKKEDLMSNILSQMKTVTFSEKNASMHLESQTGKTENSALVASAASNLSSDESQVKVNNPKKHKEFDYTNSGFVMTDKYLKKRQNIIKKGPKCKLDIKIYSPTKKKEDVAEKLDEVLEDNISKNNISTITDGVLKVSPPQWSDKRDDCRLIVLNSSSEEEDDEFDPSQRLVLLYILNDWSNLTTYHVMTMEILIKLRIWEAKAEATPLNTEKPYQNEYLGPRSKMEKKSSSQLLGYSRTNVASNLPSEVKVKDSQTLEKKKSDSGQKTESKTKSFLRN